MSYRRGMRIKPSFTTDAINEMKKLYLEDGYFLANISAESRIVGSGENQKNDIVFTINEGKKV